VTRDGEVTLRYSVPIFGYFHSFNFFGRSANAGAVLPYAFGNFHGTTAAIPQHLYRSGWWIRSIAFP